MQYVPIQAKTLLSKRTSEVGWFWNERSCNPYRGCFHGCTYCDGRNTYYHSPQPFERKIEIKMNSPELFEKELLKDGIERVHQGGEGSLLDFYEIDIPKRTPRFIVGIGGGVTDVYQPAERKFRITRKLLQKCWEFEMPTTLLTKSHFVLEDLELLTKINKADWMNVTFSVTAWDKTVQRRLEPQASSTTRRFEALQELRAQSIHGGICLMPIIPKIADDMTNLTRLLDEAVKSDAEFVMWGYLTLKPDNKKYFLDKTVRPFYPEHVSYYLETFEKKWYTWDSEVVKKLRKEIKDRGLSEITPLPVPFGRNKTNLALTEKLYLKSYELSFSTARESIERKALLDLAKKLIIFPHTVSSSSNEANTFVASLSKFQQEELSKVISL